MRLTAAPSSAWASSPGPFPPSSCRFPPATARARISPSTNPSRSPPWKAFSRPKTARRSPSSDNPTSKSTAWTIRLTVPNALSFLTYQRWHAEVRGLDSFPRDRWPDNIPLLYYSYHIMVGLGTIFTGVMALAAFALWRGALYHSRGLLWLLMLMLPFPYIATTAGWITAEVGRQPWLIYGIMRTARRILPTCLLRQRALHPDRLHGHVHGPGNSLPVPGRPRDRRGAGARRQDLRRLSRYGNHLVLPRRRDARHLRGAGRFRSRRGHRPPADRADRQGTPRRAALHRPGLGRQ